MLVNRARLADAVDIKQDLIHEFFHVLQFAHNLDGTHKGAQVHWFVEASAVWSETYYDRSNSQIPHGWPSAIKLMPSASRTPTKTTNTRHPSGRSSEEKGAVVGGVQRLAGNQQRELGKLRCRD